MPNELEVKVDPANLPFPRELLVINPRENSEIVGLLHDGRSFGLLMLGRNDFNNRRENRPAPMVESSSTKPTFTKFPAVQSILQIAHLIDPHHALN